MKTMFIKFAGVLVVMLMASGSQAATLIVDQVGSLVVAGGYTGGNVVQSFTPSQDNIVGLDAHYYAFAGTRDISVILWDIGSWNGSGFIGSALHTETLTGVSACPSGSLMCTEFRWESTPISIVSGQLYYLQFIFDDFNSGAIGAGVTNPYSGGQTLAGGGNLFNGNADLAFRTYYAPVPVPAAVWLFGSCLLGLVEMARRKRT